VTDDGCGIPPENLRRVFDPFFTTRMGKGGSGLGLNIVHTLVTGVLGGRIEVRSEPGSGTRFDITLPCFAPAAAMEPAA
jgi:signal transduction histidine kinase